MKYLIKVMFEKQVLVEDADTLQEAFSKAIEEVNFDNYSIDEMIITSEIIPLGSDENGS